MLDGAKVATALLEVGALRFDGADPFVYASHKIGPVYLDLRRLPSNPRLWAEVVDALADEVAAAKPADSYQVISGGEVADLLFSIPVAMRLGKPHVVVRKAAKTHGLSGRIAGVLAAGQSVVHVSDLITTGSSALDWVGVIRQSGAVVTDYFAVVDRMQGGGEALTAAGVRLHSLIKMNTAFIELALDQGLVSQTVAANLVSYLKDPEGWAERLLLSKPVFLESRMDANGGKLTKQEGLQILTLGYPSLSGRLGGRLRERLRALGVTESVEAVGYFPA